MKFNKWTVGLAAVGVVSLASAARADEQMSQVQTALSQTTLSGYVDTAMQWNPGTDQGNGGVLPPPGNVPHYSFAKNDGFSLNAIDVALDRPEDSSQWAAGYHIEVMAGANAVGIGGAGGNPFPIGTATLRQAFIRLHTPIGGNGIDWQIGVFDSIIGYESNSGPLNPNYTRSYGYTIEPTTFTGILGTYKVSDELSISAGIANQEFVNSYIPANTFESQKAYLGSVSLTAPDSMGFLKGATLSAGVVNNANSITGVTPGSTTSFYAGATLPTPITQLKVGAAFDYLWEADVATAAITGTANRSDNIWVIGGYATFQATDKLSFNFRGEYFSDSSNPGDTINLYNTVNAGSGIFLPGNKGEEITATLQYNLWANVMTRGEFRWDHVEHGTPFGANDAGLAFRSNDFLLALNVVYQF